MTRDEVIAEARSWRGTPWVHQACVKKVGVDCLHFVAGVLAELGAPAAVRFMATPEWRNYSRVPDAEQLLAGCDELLDRIPFAEATIADVLVFRAPKRPIHFGFLAEGPRLIHAWAVAGKVVEHRLDEAFWGSRLARAYRVPGIA